MNTEDKRVIAHAAFSYGFLMGARARQGYTASDLAARIREYSDGQHPRVNAILSTLDRHPGAVIHPAKVG